MLMCPRRLMPPEVTTQHNSALWLNMKHLHWSHMCVYLLIFPCLCVRVCVCVCVVCVDDVACVPSSEPDEALLNGLVWIWSCGLRLLFLCFLFFFCCVIPNTHTYTHSHTHFHLPVRVRVCLCLCVFRAWALMCIQGCWCPEPLL